MRIQEFMSRNVQTVGPRVAAQTAWERMKARGFHHLVVVEGGKIRGILSDRDLGGARGNGIRAGFRVEDLMTQNPVSVRPEATVRQVANILRGRGIGCVPVTTKGGRLKGIVTISDLLELLGRGLQKPTTPEPQKRKTRRGAPRLGSPPGRR